MISWVVSTFGGAGLGGRAGGDGLGGFGLVGGAFGKMFSLSALGETGLKTSDVSREASWNGSESCKGESAKGSSMLEKSIFLVTGVGSRSVLSEPAANGENISYFSLGASLRILLLVPNAGDWFSLLKMSYVLLETVSLLVGL